MSSSRKTAGSEHWYSHALVGISYSPAGRNASRRAGGANWLLDEIALQPHDKRVAAVQACRDRRLQALRALAVSDTLLVGYRSGYLDAARAVKPDLALCEICLKMDDEIP